MDTTLLKKYNTTGPRYTSYPTVPYWKVNDFNLKNWKQALTTTFQKTNTNEGVSLYIHLPFCESLCTFCGCNKRITKNHDVETPYINALLKEWSMYLNLFEKKPNIQQIHIGGGTPTFFNSENLEYLIRCILETSTPTKTSVFSFEGHPNNTTKKHLETLYNLGFRRVSFGVQDYNKTVQKAIHRIQPFNQVKKVTQWAREIGYTSIGHDIIYGLPFQKIEDIFYTIKKTKELRPDRIAFYSYAHTPWIKGNGQRGFSEENLPNATTKLSMYELGKKDLNATGYHNIGMDHFSLSSDSLYQALENKSLHRNFMGYTEDKTSLMIGLGVSAIGDSWNSFYQNVKNIDEYQNLVSKNIFSIAKGHIHSIEDLKIRKHILNLMCHYKTQWNDDVDENFGKLLLNLFPLNQDGLVTVENKTIKITPKGKPFVRNICMALDPYLKQKSPQKLFSKTI